jgi:hypothetical protein
VISRRVVNASPLIFLTEVGLLDVLHQPGVPVLVPDVVLGEIGGLGPDDTTVRAVRQSPWIQIVPAPRIPDAVLVWDLDAGESAVLAVALQEPDPMAILDDQPARRCAQGAQLGQAFKQRRQGGLYQIPALAVVRRDLSNSPNLPAQVPGRVGAAAAWAPPRGRHRVNSNVASRRVKPSRMSSLKF